MGLKRRIGGEMGNQPFRIRNIPCRRERLIGGRRDGRGLFVGDDNRLNLAKLASLFDAAFGLGQAPF